DGVRALEGRDRDAAQHEHSCATAPAFGRDAPDQRALPLQRVRCRVADGDGPRRGSTASAALSRGHGPGRAALRVTARQVRTTGCGRIVHSVWINLWL